MKEPIYSSDFIWDNDKRICTCVLTYDGHDFMGTATCHPEDEDFRNTLVGESISYTRAFIAALRYIKHTEVDIPYLALKNLYKNMQTSHRFNEASFEARMMRGELKRYEDAAAIMKATIKSSKDGLTDYINEKDAYYKAIREKRKAENK